MKIINDFVGQKFGKWTILEYDSYFKYEKHRTGYHLWKCRCECGEINLVREHNFKRGISTQCKKCSNEKLSINKTKHVIPSFVRSSIKKGARDRNLEISISFDELYDLFLKQNGRCALTNIELVLHVKRQKNRLDITASLDRIDSSKGYVIGNVQWVHKIINYMKSDLSQEDFVKWCKMVAKNN